MQTLSKGGQFEENCMGILIIVLIIHRLKVHAFYTFSNPAL